MYFFGCLPDYFEVDVRTIDNYLSNYEEELKHNGYVLCKGKMLKEFKLRFAHEIDFASKTTQLGLFDFRSFLNIGMLLNDSGKAKKLIARFLPAKTANHVRNRYGKSPIFRTDCKFLHSVLKSGLFPYGLGQNYFTTHSPPFAELF